MKHTKGKQKEKKMSKHTRGPYSVVQWYALTLEVVENTYAVCGKDGRANAFFLGSKPTQLANAQLYSAAPELLRALKIAFLKLEEMGPSTDAWNEEILNPILQAIAKAEGNTKE